MFYQAAESFAACALDKLAVAEGLLASEDHWCKGALRDGQDRYCLLGALDMAGARHLLAPVVLRVIREVSGKHYWRVEFFNDDCLTSHADILRVLRRTRETIAAGTVRLGPAEPWPRHIGAVLRAWRSRSASAVNAHLARLAGGFDRRFWHSPAAAE